MACRPLIPWRERARAYSLWKVLKAAAFKAPFAGHRLAAEADDTLDPAPPPLRRICEMNKGGCRAGLGPRTYRGRGAWTDVLWLELRLTLAECGRSEFPCDMLSSLPSPCESFSRPLSIACCPPRSSLTLAAQSSGRACALDVRSTARWSSGVRGWNPSMRRSKVWTNCCTDLFSSSMTASVSEPPDMAESIDESDVELGNRCTETRSRLLMRALRVSAKDEWLFGSWAPPSSAGSDPVDDARVALDSPLSGTAAGQHASRAAWIVRHGTETACPAWAPTYVEAAAATGLRGATGASRRIRPW